MASLKQTFLQASYPSKKPFYTLVAYLQLFALDSPNASKLLNWLKTPTKPNASPQKKINYFKPFPNLQTQQAKIICRLINLNINNFAQISDSDSNDYKECQNFVHTLQLEAGQDNQLNLSEINTIISESFSAYCSTGDQKCKFSQGEILSKANSSSKISLQNEQFSQVQDSDMSRSYVEQYD